jgi:hypothetical protein
MVVHVGIGQVRGINSGSGTSGGVSVISTVHLVLPFGLVEPTAYA